jgi:WD40 repeat protein
LADIFISYAQKAPEPTQTLAAELAALNYSVWFDQRLLPIDTFVEVINKELDDAKAVITIWTPPALDSRWVKAEAARADRKGKLINVHTPDVDPGDLPVPFNISNVTAVANRVKIYQALAQLGAHPSGVAPSQKDVREASEVALAFEHIRESTDIADFEAFLTEYGQGKPFYARLARKRIALLGTRISAAGSVAGLATAKAVSAAVPEVPLPKEGDVFLRIEPGMHTAPIRRIGVNAAGTLMVTGSDDKTARLWALPKGGRGNPQLLRTLRVPIGEGHEGRVAAVALSPDSSWIAAGGWSKNDDVYIFEAAAGRLVTRLSRLGNVIDHLAFSPDGSRLAATLGGEGMRLWETSGWRLLAVDKDYGSKHSLGAAFDGANRLYTVAYDGQIRQYGADGHLEAKAPTQGGNEPCGVAVHPQGGKLAIGFNDTTAVEVYDTASLKRLYAADTSGINGGNLAAVTWSADGTLLYAGGRHRSGSACPVVIWQNEGRGNSSLAPLLQDTIQQILPCTNGLAVGAQEPAFGLMAIDGAKRVWREGVIPDMRNINREFPAVSADTKSVRFGLDEAGTKRMLFELPVFQLTDSAGQEKGLKVPKTSGLAVTDWKNNTEPKLNGKPLALTQYEISRALAIAPDASRFVLGTEWYLRAYRADGGELWQKVVPGVAWGVNISGNGRLVAAAYGDGTIRWHRLSDGEELLALFVHAKDRRHIAWTPKGYYAASDGAEDLIGWHVNRGFDATPDFYPASTFASTFNRPDIVKAALDI